MQVTSPAEELLFTTIRVEALSTSGEKSVGTAFVLSLQAGDDRTALFLVTNKHVVKDSQTGWLTFTIAEGNAPKLGHRYVLRVDDFEKMFLGHEHPDVDVAVAPFLPILQHLSSQGVSIFFKAVPDSIIPNEQQLEELDALEDVVFIGYPNGIWDSENNLPVIRRGVTATPIVVDFQNEPKFLVDAAVFPGSSGSPVFLYNMGTYWKKGGGTVVGGRVMFLGIMAAVFFREASGRIEMVDIPTAAQPVAITPQMINLGIVFKARAVVEVARRRLGL